MALLRRTVLLFYPVILLRTVRKRNLLRFLTFPFNRYVQLTVGAFRGLFEPLSTLNPCFHGYRWGAHQQKRKFQLDHMQPSMY